MILMIHSKQTMKICHLFTGLCIPAYMTVIFNFLIVYKLTYKRRKGHLYVGKANILFVLNDSLNHLCFNTLFLFISFSVNLSAPFLSVCVCLCLSLSLSALPYFLIFQILTLSFILQLLEMASEVLNLQQTKPPNNQQQVKFGWPIQIRLNSKYKIMAWEFTMMHFILVP